MLAGGRAARPTAVLLRAPLGGGKSRVLDEVATAAASKGQSIHHVLTTSASVSVPFGAVAHLLPPGARVSSDPVGLIGALRDVLAPRDGRRALVVIDDATSLDHATAGVLASLVGSREIDVVAAARADATLPGPLLDVVFGDRTLLVDLPALTEDDINSLLHSYLGGPMDGAVLVSLRDRSMGNPLFLRELVRSALDAGTLARVDGVWRLRGQLSSSFRLREVIESRLNVAPETRAVLELLALCDIADVEELEGLVGLEVLANLESRGLIEIKVRSGRECAVLCHLLHGEAIRMALPSLRSRLVLRNHIQWIDEHTPDSGSDALQRAMWRVDAGLPADLDSLLRGAQLAAALQDSVSALRLARPLFEVGPTAELGSLIADALYRTGQWAEAFEILDLASALPAASKVRVELAVIRATVMLWGLGDPDGALRTMEVMRADPAMERVDLDRLNAEYAAILVNAGRPGEALAELENAAATGRRRTQLSIAVSHAQALAMAGHTTRALVAMDSADALMVRVGGVIGPANGAFLVARVVALIEAGDLARAVQLAEEGYERAVNASRPLNQFWISLLLGRALLLQGAIQTSLMWFDSARALGFHLGLSGPVRRALTGCAVTHALAGDPVAAAESLAEIDQTTPFGFMAPEQALADAWVAVANGNLAEARAVLTAGALDAMETGHVTSAVWMLHDVARLGDASDVADLITQCADGSESAFVRARAAHVRAIVANDLDAMVAAAAEFETIGANLLASEAYVAAAELARATGIQRTATAMTQRAERLAALCEGALSPGLIAAPDTIEPLTEREREVAFMASSGMTSREIADHLVVSLRTVSNHLQHVYDKLGVRSRTELRHALGGPS